jgi:hypothetical protein
MSGVGGPPSADEVVRDFMAAFMAAWPTAALDSASRTLEPSWLRVENSAATCRSTGGCPTSPWAWLIGSSALGLECHPPALPFGLCRRRSIRRQRLATAGCPL